MSLQSALSRRGIHYGWVVVAIEGTYVPAFMASGVLCVAARLLCLPIGRASKTGKVAGTSSGLAAEASG